MWFLQLLRMLVQVQLPWLQNWMDYHSEQEPQKVCDESAAGMTVFLRFTDEDDGGMAEQLERPLLAGPAMTSRLQM